MIYIFQTKKKNTFWHFLVALCFLPFLLLLQDPDGGSNGGWQENVHIMTERTSAAPDSSGKEGGHQRSCRYHIFVIGCAHVRGVGGGGGMHHSGSSCHIPVIGAPIIGPIIRVPAAFSLAPSLFCHIVIILANINIYYQYIILTSRKWDSSYCSSVTE